MAEQISSIEIPSFETEPAVYEEVVLDVGEWNIFPDSTNFGIIARLTEGSDAKIVQSGRGIVVKISTPSTSVFLQATCPKDTTCKATYTNSFFFSSGGVGGSGGGGGGGSYTFSAPLNESGGNVSLNLAGDLQVISGNLTLKLTSNQDFMQLAQLVQGLSSGIEWVGKTTDTNAQVTADHQLLSNFVQTRLGRAPKVGDLVLTADIPPYGWVYTNAYDPATGQVAGQDWETIGTTSVSIATQSTVGLVKGSAEMNIDTDGAITANAGKIVKIEGDQTISGVKKFHNDVEFGTIIKAGWNGSNVLFCPEDNSTKTLKFRNTSIGANNKFNIDLENNCELIGIKDPTQARSAVPRDWANNTYVKKVNTTDTITLQTTTQASKYFNIDYVVTQTTGYRNWSGIKLRAKRGTGNFVEMWKIEYRNEDNLGIFMACVGSKLTFDTQTKIHNISCEDADGDNTATNKSWVVSKIGDVTTLTTTQRANIVGAVNELDSEIGDLTALTTTEQSSLVGAINEIDASVDANTNALNSKADDNAVVKLTGDQTIGGNKTFSGTIIFGGRLEFSGTNTSFAPSTDRSGDIFLSNGQIGQNCYANLNLENKGKIKGNPDPVDDRDGVPKIYVDTKVGDLSQLTTTAQDNLVDAVNEVNRKYIVIPYQTDPANVLQEGEIGLLELS